MDYSTLDLILFFVQVLSLVALVIYVIKTAEMAQGTRQSAAATEKSVEEMRADRDQQVAPYIVVYFDHMNDSPIFDLVVKNTGKSVARDVNISFEPPLDTSLKNYDIQRLAFVHMPIPTFPPDYEIRASMDVLANRLRSDSLPRVYHVAVTFRGGIDNDLRTAEYILDLNVFSGILETHVRSLSDLTRAVENIPDSIEALSNRIDVLHNDLGLLGDKVNEAGKNLGAGLKPF